MEVVEARKCGKWSEYADSRYCPKADRPQWAIAAEGEFGRLRECPSCLSLVGWNPPVADGYSVRCGGCGCKLIVWQCHGCGREASAADVECAVCSRCRVARLPPTAPLARARERVVPKAVAIIAVVIIVAAGLWRMIPRGPDREIAPLWNAYLALFEQYQDVDIARDISKGLKSGKIRMTFDPYLGAEGPPFSYSAKDDAIFISRTWLAGEKELGIPIEQVVENSAGIVAHEMRHALNHSAGMALNSREDEITACIEAFLFTRQLLKRGKGSGLDEINRVIEVGDCAPWWDCPISEKQHSQVADRATKALHAARGIKESDVLKLLLWHGVKSIRGGWASAESFCAMNIDQGRVTEASIFTDELVARERLESLIAEGAKAQELADDSDPRIPRLRKNLKFLNSELDVWEDPKRLMLRQAFYRKELNRLKELVEREASRRVD